MNLPPTSATPIERLRRAGIRPDRALGQNFLIDPNILDVIERAAALGPEDVALEVGPGLGVLTERLVSRCRAVHAVEMDRRLAGLLADEFGARPGFRLHPGDAMHLHFGEFDPAPTKFVANLPYNVAAPLVMKSLEELPSVGLWCLMVQKEIADRLFAAPGSAGYGGVSVMTQLMTRKLSARNISANVFYPQPRVRSSLLVFKRRSVGGSGGGQGKRADAAPGAGPAPAVLSGEEFSRLKQFVYAAFSHRRKMLANSLAEADPSPAPLTGLRPADRRSLVESTLKQLDLSPHLRAQALTPPDFVRLAKLITERSSAGAMDADVGANP